MSAELQQLIETGCKAQRLPVTQEVVDKLTAFVTLLAKWNRVYNLTAVRQPADMVDRHILDSLVVLPWIKGPNLLDVGSGAGIPGLPLAIVKPDVAVTCLDASAKKVRFMCQAVSELGLQNVQVKNQRVEQYIADAPFQQVISRAFSSLLAMHQNTAHVCAANGELLAMKGTIPTEELMALQALGLNTQVIELHVPGLDAERHLVRWSPTNDQLAE
jgi:16S rRNA (guanine527-N7)-methyltransferase